MKYKILKSNLNDKQQAYILSKISNLPFEKSEWYGEHSVVIYNQENQSDDSLFLKAITATANMLKAKQDFNTIVIRRFKEGQFMTPHTDSRNTVGTSLSIILGSAEKTNYRFDSETEEICSGDIIIQKCTNGYSMGPHYCMFPVKDGIQYSVTLSTILKENPV